MSWISLILGLLKLANLILEDRQKRGLIREGEDRAVAKALLEMANRRKSVQAIQEEYAKLPHSEVLKRLEGDFRD